MHGIALKHSPLQQIFNILGFKSEWEAKHGSIKSEALSKLYEDKVTWANQEDAAVRFENNVDFVSFDCKIEGS